MRTIDTEKNFNKEYLMRNILIVLSMMVVFPVMADEYLGQLSENPYGEGLSIYGDDDG